MTELSNEELHAKWKQRMTNAVGDVKRGVQNTKKSQTANAIKAQEKYVAKLQESIANGTWKKGLEEAGDEAWKNGMLNKGADKIVAGINANETKIKQKMALVNEVGKAAKMATENMPNNNTEDAIAKIRRNIEVIKEAWKK